MYYITENDVKENLGMRETIDILEEAFSAHANGKAFYRPRERIIFDGTVYNTMPGVFQQRNLAGLKTYIANKKGARFVVLVFDTVNSELLAVIEADRLGQVRTGALPAMVTRKLVKKKAQSLCVIGSGYQAETQLLGMNEVFDLASANVYSRNYEHAQNFSRRMSREFGIDVTAHDNVKSALNGATIVNTITDANEAIFSRSDLGDEYHVNLCGGNIPTRREAAEDVLTGSDMVVVEDLEQAMKESGEIISLKENHPQKRIIALGDMMNMKEADYAGKNRTVFKSMGIGLEDVAAAYVLMKNMGII